LLDGGEWIEDYKESKKKCTCGNTELKKTNMYYDENGREEEYKLYCPKCQSDIGIWAFGYFYQEKESD
jgi:Zn finger protein HypA/HybF involved in hydrogenase expression